MLLSIARDVVHAIACLGLRNDTTGELDFSRYSNNLPGKNLIVSLASAEEFFTVQVLNMLLVSVSNNQIIFSFRIGFCVSFC